MSKVKMHIWHNQDGRITAIGCSCLNYRVSVIPPENNFVLEIEIDKYLIKKFYRAKTIAEIDLPKSIYFQLLNLNSEQTLNRDRPVLQQSGDRLRNSVIEQSY